MNQIGLFDITGKRHRGNKFSELANPNQNHKKETHERILKILSSGERTGKEISEILEVPFNTISGRFSELKALRKIRGLGFRRNGSEVLAIVGGFF